MFLKCYVTILYNFIVCLYFNRCHFVEELSSQAFGFSPLLWKSFPQPSVPGHTDACVLLFRQELSQRPTMAGSTGRVHQFERLIRVTAGMSEREKCVVY